MHVRAIVAATALAVSAVLVAPASSALCADTSAYAPIATQVSACEGATGVKLTPPLTSVQTKSICKTCAALAATTKAKALPNCTLAGGSTLQALYDSVFVCSSVLDSTAGSGDAGGTTPTPTPKTVTPTPTPTTATPATPTPTPTSTPKPATDAPSTTAPSSPSPTSGAGSGSGGTPRPTTKSPATTTKAPTSATPSSRPSSSTTTDGSGSQNQTAGKKDGTNDDKIAVTIGIAGGVIVFVVIVAALIVCRHRRRNRDDKLDDELLSPSTRALTPGYAPSPARQSTTPARGSGTPGTVRNSAPTYAAYGGQRGSVPRYSGGGGGGQSGPRYSAGTGGAAAMAVGSSSGGGRSSGSSQYAPRGGLWDDEVIISARVPREKVLSETLLSRGGFGEVYRGTYNGQVVAIKTLLPEAKKSLKQINAFLSEIRLMATLEHERIVSFIGVAWDSLNDLCVVAEYMEGGDLRAVLTRFEDVEHRRHGFDHDKIRIATHIAHALTYLHSLQPVVLHRDLKSKNILLDQHLNAKLTDFGVSRERSDTTTMTAGVGTSLWMAPEVMLGERYDEKSDIFSFGVVLSELDSHALPYAHAKAVSSDSGHRLPDTAILQLVSLGRLSVQFSPHANPTVVALARACVAVNPVERPTAADVLYRLHSLRKHY